ncbi:MAG: hypothetical protein LBM74_09845 [Oscillospiraceae bacterium]|jgi:hypothetical protein|nr:hypothetical protein [Oscillospiraceae bacterium]
MKRFVVWLLVIAMLIPMGMTAQGALAEGAAAGLSFDMKGHTYRLLRLEDEPSIEDASASIAEELEKNKNLHCIVFTGKLDALVTNWRDGVPVPAPDVVLIAPDGSVIKPRFTQTNWSLDSLDLVFRLYFDLPVDALLADCTLRLNLDTGAEDHPLGEAKEAPTPVPTPAPTPVPTQPPPNAPGTTDVSRMFNGQTMVVQYLGASIDEESGQIAVTIQSTNEDVQLFSIKFTGGQVITTTPFWARIIVDGVTLQCVNFKYNDGKLTFLFDTDQTPDIVILLPEDNPDDLSAWVYVDGTTGLILDPATVSLTPTATPAPTATPTPTPAPTQPPPNAPGTTDVSRIFDGQTVVAQYVGASIDEESGQMAVTIQSTNEDVPLLSISFTGGQLNATAPFWAKIVVDGVMLECVNFKHNDGKLSFLFDTDQTPDTLVLYPEDNPDDLSAWVYLDGTTGVILDPSTIPLLPTPAPPPTAFSDLSENVNTLLADLAEAEENPWQKAIYAAGAQNFAQDGGAVSFFLRTFNPRLGELGTYNANDKAWTEGFVKNIQAYDLAVTLHFSADGSPSTASLAALKARVMVAANETKTAFASEAVQNAIADAMLPSPVQTLGTDTTPALTEAYSARMTSLGYSGADALAGVPLFYGRSVQNLSIEYGPHTLTLICQCINPGALLAATSRLALEALSERPLANAMEKEEIEAFVQKILYEQTEVVRETGVKRHYYFTFDIDGFVNGAYGKTYDEYLTTYFEDYASMLASIIQQVANMPDAPALPFPETGRISGSTSGTQAIIKAPAGDEAYYVQFRSVATDATVVDLFIRPGESATVYMPKGLYYLQIASGETWYGLESKQLFGEDGSTSRTENTEIMSSEYYHTFTLEHTTDGNISEYGADPADFFK